MKKKLSLTVTKLSCKRNSIDVFNSLFFKLSEGQVLIIKGKNGKGKTTLLHCLAGILPYEGSIKWQQKFDKIGYVGHKFGLKEKDITLAIAKKLRDAINKEPNLQGVLIRDGDYFIPLAKRVAKARKLEADLFVSIHADAFTKKSVKGSSVFALSERGASSAFAKFIANKENESDLIGGVSIDDKHPVLAQTLLDLSLSATINDSMKLGRYVLDEMGKVNTLHKKYVEQAGFAVLKAPDIPSILVETAFISNPKEEKNLRSESFQIKLAESVVKGIKTYLKTGANLAFFYEPEQ